MMIAQAQMEAMSNPSITNLTTGWAVMKSSKNEKPPVVAGLITSRGFIASVQSQMCKARGNELARLQKQVRGGAPAMPWGCHGRAGAPAAEAPPRWSGGSRDEVCPRTVRMANGSRPRLATAHAYAVPAFPCDRSPVCDPPNCDPYWQAMRRDLGFGRRARGPIAANGKSQPRWSERAEAQTLVEARAPRALPKGACAGAGGTICWLGQARGLGDGRGGALPSGVLQPG